MSLSTDTLDDVSSATKPARADADAISSVLGHGDTPDLGIDTGGQETRLADEPGELAPRRSTRSKKLIATAALLIVLMGAGAIYSQYDRFGRYQQETNDATIQADQVAISSKLAGYIRAVSVNDNQRIAQGAALVEIDPSDFASKLQAAEADIAASVEAERSVTAGRAEALAEVARARAGLAAAQATFDFGVREINRLRPLVAAGAEPASRLSELLANRDRAAAEVAAQQAGIDQAIARTGTVMAQAAQFRAQTDVARAKRVVAANDLSSTRLVAPITGRVANRSVRVGQYVQQGARLMTLVPSDGLFVVANFKETQVGLMRPGQSASIEIDALPGVKFSGVVESVSPGTGASFSLIPPQNATGNFTKIVQRIPVRIRIAAGPAARRVLVPGLSLSVVVDTRSGRKNLQSIGAEQSHEKQ